jgi:hypothetical protein
MGFDHPPRPRHHIVRRRAQAIENVPYAIRHEDRRAMRC